MPVKLQGAVALRKALAIVEPTLAKETSKEIASFLKPVVKQARGYMPNNDQIISGWLVRSNATGRWATRSYDSAVAKRGITYKSTPSRTNRNGFQALATIFNKSIAGIIYEWAGRTSGITGNFSPRLGGEIKGTKQGMRGRAIFRAFEEDRGKAQDGVVKAIFKAKDKFDSMKDKV
jgi:hypothetical protein